VSLGWGGDPKKRPSSGEDKWWVDYQVNRKTEGFKVLKETGPEENEKQRGGLGVGSSKTVNPISGKGY